MMDVSYTHCCQKDEIDWLIDWGTTVFGMLVTIYKSTWYNVPEGLNAQ
jgi:hypothetical protein